MMIVNITSTYDKTWHSDGNQVGMDENITSTNQVVPLNGLFYCNLYDIIGDLGYARYQPSLRNINVNNIPASAESKMDGMLIIYS